MIPARTHVRLLRCPRCERDHELVSLRANSRVIGKHLGLLNSVGRILCGGEWIYVYAPAEQGQSDERERAAQ